MVILQVKKLISEYLYENEFLETEAAENLLYLCSIQVFPNWQLVTNKNCSSQSGESFLAGTQGLQNICMTTLPSDPITSSRKLFKFREISIYTQSYLYQRCNPNAQSELKVCSKSQN